MVSCYAKMCKCVSVKYSEIQYIQCNTVEQECLRPKTLQIGCDLGKQKHPRESTNISSYKLVISSYKLDLI